MELACGRGRERDPTLVATRAALARWCCASSGAGARLRWPCSRHAPCTTSTCGAHVSAARRGRSSKAQSATAASRNDGGATRRRARRAPNHAQPQNDGRHGARARCAAPRAAAACAAALRGSRGCAAAAAQRGGRASSAGMAPAAGAGCTPLGAPPSLNKLALIQGAQSRLNVALLNVAQQLALHTLCSPCHTRGCVLLRPAPGARCFAPPRAVG